MESFEATIQLYINPLLGSRKVSSLTTEDVRAVKQHLLQRRVAGDRPMAASTARRVLGKLHDMLNHALVGNDARDYWGLSFDPWPKRRLRWPDERDRPAPHTHEPYSLDEARQFLAASPEELRAAFLHHHPDAQTGRVNRNAMDEP